MPPRQRECGGSVGLPGGGPFGGNAFGRRCPSAAAVPSAVMPLRAGERFRSEKLVGTEKAVIFAPRTSGSSSARQGASEGPAATVGNNGPAVGSGWQRHDAGDGFGCFGTQTAPPTCSDGGSDGRRKQTGCSAVRLAHLLWEQGVAGSNPVSPTMDNQPLAATQVVFHWGRRHTIYTQNRGFPGCIKASIPA